DLYFHTKESVFTFYYAAFTIATGKFLYFHLRAVVQTGAKRYYQTVFTRQLLHTWSLVLGTGAVGLGASWALLQSHAGSIHPGFVMQRLDASHTGIATEMGQLLTEVDPRGAHIAKWVMSVGDAVAVADVDNDGLMD